jgi:hypothetical protein
LRKGGQLCSNGLWYGVKTGPVRSSGPDRSWHWSWSFLIFMICSLDFHSFRSIFSWYFHDMFMRFHFVSYDMFMRSSWDVHSFRSMFSWFSLDFHSFRFGSFRSLVRSLKPVAWLLETSPVQSPAQLHDCECCIVWKSVDINRWQSHPPTEGFWASADHEKQKTKTEKNKNEKHETKKQTNRNAKR